MGNVGTSLLFKGPSELLNTTSDILGDRNGTAIPDQLMSRKKQPFNLGQNMRSLNQDNEFKSIRQLAEENRNKPLDSDEEEILGLGGEVTESDMPKQQTANNQSLLDANTAFQMVRRSSRLSQI